MIRFYVAALTGKSGSGKSYASEYLACKGVPSIDGDDVARQVMVKGSPCLKTLVREFSKDILTEDGELNRRLLADICFSDERKKERLNYITHPYIIEEILNGFDRLHEQGYSYCLVEAAALIESGLYANCNKIILVKARIENEIARIMLRDGISEEQAKTRIFAQSDLDMVERLADVIIDNDGTLEEFNQKLDALHLQLEEWFR